MRRKCPFLRRARQQHFQARPILKHRIHRIQHRLRTAIRLRQRTHMNPSRIRLRRRPHPLQFIEQPRLRLPPDIDRLLDVPHRKKTPRPIRILNHLLHQPLRHPPLPETRVLKLIQHPVIKSPIQPKPKILLRPTRSFISRPILNQPRNVPKRQMPLPPHLPLIPLLIPLQKRR